MTTYLALQFDAPMMSFGAPIVDSNGDIQPHPSLSMMTGLIGNALGFDHAEFERLEQLQARLQYGSRRDRRGERIEDYQTVELGSDYMDDDRAWTTRGELERRAGGSASEGTHIRHRDYWADARHTVVVTLEAPRTSPTLVEVADALREPERPLFVGRKTCLPAASLLRGALEADDVREALIRVPLPDGEDDSPTDRQGRPRRRGWWPTAPGGDTDRADLSKPVTDRRDWSNQIHVGERWIAAGTLHLEPEELRRDV